MVKSATPAGMEDLNTALFVTLPGLQQLHCNGHCTILPPTAIPGERASIAARSTTPSQSVYNDHLSVGDNMPVQEGTSPPTAEIQFREALSEPLTESGTSAPVPRAEEETRSWVRVPEVEQRTTNNTTEDSEPVLVQEAGMEQARTAPLARQLAEAEAAAVLSQAELRAAYEREVQVHFRNILSLCSTLILQLICLLTLLAPAHSLFCNLPIAVICPLPPDEAPVCMNHLPPCM